MRLWLILTALALPAQGQESPESRALKILERPKQFNADLFQAIAIVQARAGDAQAAEATFLEILKAAPEEGANVAVAKARAGDLKGAIALAETLKEGWITERKNAPYGGGTTRLGSLRTDALEKIVAFLGDSKRWAEAPAIIALLPETPREGHPADLTARQEALHKLAVAQAKAGDPAAAELTAKVITSQYYRQEAFKEIVAAWIKRGELKESLQADENITYPHLKIDTLIAIATAQAQAGDGPGAKETFQRSSEIASRLMDRRVMPSSRVSALSRISAAQMLIGDRAAAVETMKQAMAGSRELDLENIAVGQARVGALDLALTKADSIQVGWRRVHALMSIAGVMAEAGILAKAEELFSKARLIAEAIQEDHIRTVTLLEVGKAQVEAGFVSATLETAGLLTHLHPEKWDLLQRIVKAQLTAGDLKGARTTADLILLPWMKQVSLREIALATARGGDVKAALELVETFPDGSQAPSFQELSSILLERGELGPALQMALRIDQTELAGQALRKIAFVQTTKGDEAGALAWASALKSSSHKAYALLGVAEGILETSARSR
jgi:hypothetical protein